MLSFRYERRKKVKIDEETYICLNEYLHEVEILNNDQLLNLLDTLDKISLGEDYIDQLRVKIIKKLKLYDI